MKKIIIILLIAITTIALQAQAPTQVQAQQVFTEDNETVNKPHEVKKYAYQFMGEFSLVHLGIGFDLPDPYIGFNFMRIGFNLINNMVYKEKISTGLGIGMEYAVLDGEMALPLFADFRYYFTEKKVKPFINVGIGTVFIIHFARLGLFGSSSNDIFIYKPGLYLNCSGGFKFGRFLFNAGVNVKAYEWVYYDRRGNAVTLDFVVKLGFNI